MNFYVGVWTIQQARNTNKFMYSVRNLMRRKSSINLKNWYMDSGAFSEISLNGKYRYNVYDYLDCVKLQQPELFFNMDYMCEPFILEKTGLSIKEHQELTVDNQIKIMDNIDDINSMFAGCIQGWKIEDYIDHIDMLKDQGLITEIMGVGSICRRNKTYQIISILEAIKSELPNTKLHGFGIKTSILKYPAIYNLLHSCDSMAWSFAGRNLKEKPCNNCIYQTKNCGNCYRFMNFWNDKIQEIISDTTKQKTLM